MKPTHLCCYHARRIQQDEALAFRSWSEMTHRGKIAYSECRTDAAKVYLSAAIEIYILRASIPKNALFSVTSLSQPLSLLTDLLIMENRFEDGVRVLSGISTASCKNAMRDQHRLYDVLGEHYEKLEMAERTYLNAGKASHTDLRQAGAALH